MGCSSRWTKVLHWGVAAAVALLLCWPQLVRGEGHKGDVSAMAVASFSAGGGGGGTTSKKKDEEQLLKDMNLSKSASKADTSAAKAAKTASSTTSKSASKTLSSGFYGETTSKQKTSATAPKASDTKTSLKKKAATKTPSSTSPVQAPSSPARSATPIADQLAQDVTHVYSDAQAANTTPSYDYGAALQQGLKLGSAASYLDPSLFLPIAAIGTMVALGQQQPNVPPEPVPSYTTARNPITGKEQVVYTYDPQTGEPIPQGFASPDYQVLSGYRYDYPQAELLYYTAPNAADPNYALKIPDLRPAEEVAAERASQRATEARQNYQLTIPGRESEAIITSPTGGNYILSYPELGPNEEVVGISPEGARIVKYTPAIPPEAIPEPWRPSQQQGTSGPPAAQPVTSAIPSMPAEPPPVDQWTPPPGMTLEEALALAEALYGPQYAELLRQRLQAQSIDLLRRGFYGQLPGYNLLMDVQARTAAERAAAERAYAEQLLRDREAAQREYERMKAEWELQNQQLNQSSSQNKVQNLLKAAEAVTDFLNTLNRVRASIDTGTTSATGVTTPSVTAPQQTNGMSASAKQTGVRPAVNLTEPLKTYPEGLYTPPNVAFRPISVGVS